MNWNDKTFSEEELKGLGFKKIGTNIKISKNILIVGIENISLGSNIRIDDFTCIIAKEGFLKLYNNIHISSSCHLLCTGGISMKSFSGLSQGVKIYSASDNFNSGKPTNPTTPSNSREIIIGEVTLEQHVIVGSNSVILPKTHLKEGSAVGALSLVNKNLDEWTLYQGNPVKRVKARIKIKI